MCGGNYKDFKKHKALSLIRGEVLVERTIRLLEENGVDSYTYISMLVSIEEEYNIELEDSLLVMDETMTINNLCRLIYEFIEGQKTND